MTVIYIYGVMKQGEGALRPKIGYYGGKINSEGCAAPIRCCVIRFPLRSVDIAYAEEGTPAISSRNRAATTLPTTFWL